MSSEMPTSIGPDHPVFSAYAPAAHGQPGDRRTPVAHCLGMLSGRQSAWRPSWVTQPAPQGVQHRHAPDVLPEVEDDLPRLVNHESRTMHQFLQHRPQPAPFGGMADRA